MKHFFEKNVLFFKTIFYKNRFIIKEKKIILNLGFKKTRIFKTARTAHTTPSSFVSTFFLVMNSNRLKSSRNINLIHLQTLPASKQEGVRVDWTMLWIFGRVAGDCPNNKIPNFMIITNTISLFTLKGLISNITLGYFCHPSSKMYMNFPSHFPKWADFPHLSI